MNQRVCYQEMPVWDSAALPAAAAEKQYAEAGSWVRLTVLRGEMTLTVFNDANGINAIHRCSAQHQPPVITPLSGYHIDDCSADLQCRTALYCEPEDFYHRKYGLTRTHSEVISAARQIAPCKALDLGCGSGRNSLYLNLLGFDVTALDKNAIGISSLQNIMAQEQLKRIGAEVYNINEARIQEQYGLIISTVVLMFLEAERIPAIIKNMQDSTVRGGYNLIVSAMSTPDAPCQVPFSFTFKPGELSAHYQGWELVKYNEDLGELHKTDAEGNRIKLRFATLLARKK